MTPDEMDVRRALEARSGRLSPEFRNRLWSVLAEGRPAAPDHLPALALVAALLLALATIGVFALVRHATPRPVPGAVSPSRLSTPTPLPDAASSARINPSPVPGVLTPPPGPIQMPADAYLSAPSDNVVWALVNSAYLFESTNRGSTWTQRPLPPMQVERLEISFVDDREGWLLGIGSPETQCNGEGADIWHTADAGATWQELGARGIAYAQCKRSLSFVDATDGFATAWDQNSRPVIYRTSDGGKSWSGSAPLPDPPGFTSSGAGVTLEAGDVRAFGATLLVPAFGEQSGAPVQFIYRSTDGGATWIYIATAESSGNPVVFLNATHWLEGPFAETTDAGATWHPMATDYTQAAGVAPQVAFADDRVGYATVRGGIQVTVDGGVHWTAIRTPGT